MTLELRSIVAGYKGTDILGDVSLTVEAGSCVAILGPNGVGKSTLLRAVSGQLRIRAGARLIDGVDTSGRRAHQVARAGVRWVGEPRPLALSLTVEENLLVGGTLRRREIPRNRARVLDLMPVLAQKRFERAGSLSGGQQQLLAIGQALMSEPRYLLLDEPSIGLAVDMVDSVVELIRSLRADGVGIMWAEQFPDVAIANSDRFVVLGAGTVRLAGASSQLPQDGLERAYLGLAASESAEHHPSRKESP